MAKRCSSAASAHFNDDDRARTRRQLLQPTPDRRQCRFVPGKKVPIEIVGHDERPARTADAQVISGTRLLRPACSGTIAMQDEIDRQRIRRGVVAARGVVPRRRPHRAFRIDRSVRAWRREHRLVITRVREEQLHMIVVGRADEPRQRLAADHDANHLGADAAHLANLQQPRFCFVTNAASRAFGGIRNLRHLRHCNGLL